MKQRINKEYYVEVLASKGLLYNKYKVNFEDSYNPNKILENFFQTYPNYRSKEFLIQVKTTDSKYIKDNIPEYDGIYGEDLLSKCTDLIYDTFDGVDSEVIDYDYHNGEATAKVSTTLNEKLSPTEILNRLTSAIKNIPEIDAVKNVKFIPDESEEGYYTYEIDFDFYYDDYWNEEEYESDLVNEDKFKSDIFEHLHR